MGGHRWRDGEVVLVLLSNEITYCLRVDKGGETVRLCLLMVLAQKSWAHQKCRCSRIHLQIDVVCRDCVEEEMMSWHESCGHMRCDRVQGKAWWTWNVLTGTTKLLFKQYTMILWTELHPQYVDLDISIE